MSKVATALAAFLLLAPSLASADVASFSWLNATIRYDPGVWQIRAPGGSADLLLTCIAADCPGRPTLYGFAWRIGPADRPCIAIGGDRPGADTSNVTATPLAFAVDQFWSGCRARDEPILEACAAAGDTAWRIVSHLGRSGCNRNPVVPDHRLIELLKGIAAEPARP